MEKLIVLLGGDLHIRTQTLLNLLRTSSIWIVGKQYVRWPKKSTGQRELRYDLGMSHVSAQLVPRLLIDNKKLSRVSACRKFLARCRRDSTFLSRIITTDETWVHYYEPEDKRMSMVLWRSHDSPPPKKAKVVKSMGKVMCIVFMDCSGIVLVHMVKAGSTVNADYYYKLRMSLLDKIKKRITGVTLKERYEAAMVIGAVGDALGYRNGTWETCHSGEEIHEQLEELGGVNNIKVNPKDWMISDDTVMHMATAEALLEWFQSASVAGSSPEPQEQLYLKLAEKYIESMNDMEGRAPGSACRGSCKILDPSKSGGCIIPFNPNGGGCGAAMRAMCIGLFYPNPDDIDKLIAVSLESGRMTHHHPTGYLGAMTTALFTSYAVQDKPLKEWGAGLMQELPKALEYIKNTKIDVEQNVEAWGYFTRRWTKYLELRDISDGKKEPKLPHNPCVIQRDAFYKSISYGCRFGGDSGHDAPMIAYDALLGFDGRWSDFCSRAMFHAGDSDSTGHIAACIYGAMFGYKGVNKNNYRKLEYRERLRGLGEQLYIVSHPKEDHTQNIRRQESTEATED